MWKPHPRLYLDTNILIDYIHERERSSINLINRIRTEKWECMTSSFTALEIYDVEQLEEWVQDRRLKHWMFDKIMRNQSRRRGKKIGLTEEQLTAVHTRIRNSLISFKDCIQFILLNDTISTVAEQYCATTNIGATDALHLATAWYMACDILVTNDDDFLGIVKRNINVVVTKSKEFDKTFIEYSKAKQMEMWKGKGT
jgi:predicted nucleic acid-binding protein